MSYAMDSIQYRLQSTSKTSIVYYAGLVIISIALIITTIMGAIHVHSTYVSTPMCVIDGASPYQLPRTVIPLTYNLNLKPDLNTLKYDGMVAIKLKVLTRTKCVVLNSEDLDFASKDITLSDTNGKTVSLQELRFDKNTTKVLMKFSRMFDVNEELSLQIAFRSKLRDDLVGFYKSTHKTADGETKVIATTQFESQFARSAFPCFDEPNFKAKFRISIQIKPVEVQKVNMRVLSNMPEEQRTVLPDGSSIVLFQESPLMSTYLVAFIVGEFDHVEAIAEDGTVFRVYSLPGNGEKGRYLLGVAQGITKFLNEYFNVNYALPKMDLIGIPDFGGGAMENYGLITFRAAYLLVDNETAQADIEGAAEVVAHEIAHQWTGNLITTNWWSHIWLNEGFATFFETLSLDAIRPEWNRWETKLTGSIQRVLATDSQPSTHPLVNPVLQVNEIEEVFDTITYDKGGAILLMFYKYLGADVFKSWMREYFKTYKWTNTETPQLFAILEQVTKKEGIAKQFSTWTYNAGYPLVTVEKQTGSNKYSLSQSRFYSNKPDELNNSTLWWVPISVKLSSGETKRIELAERKMENALTVTGGQWFKINTEHGFYRVNYPSENWLALFDNFDKLSTYDKFGIVDDSFALTFSGNLNIRLALKIITALEQEDSFVIWDIALSHFNRIYRLIAREPIGAHYARMILDLIEEKYEELGWSSANSIEPSSDDAKLRTLILSTATAFGSTDAIEKSHELYSRFVHQNETIDPEIRMIVYKAVVNNYGEAAYYSILNRFLSNDTDSQERTRLMYALAWAKDPSLLKNTLELSLSPKIRSQDCAYLIREVARNPYGQGLAWEFTREYYTLIAARAGPRSIGYRLVPGTTDAFSTKTRYNEAKEFFQTHKITLGANAALETIVTNEQFLKRSYNDLSAFLKEEYGFQKHH